MKGLILFISLGVLSGVSSFACECTIDNIQNVRDSSIEYSDIIFTGRVTIIDRVNQQFGIEVIKSIKGKVRGELIASPMMDSATYAYCTFWPNKYWGEDYIIYANYAPGTKTIYISDCSATRSLSNPQIHLSYYSDAYVHLQNETKKSDRELKRIANGDLKKELAFLKSLFHH